MQSGPGRGRRNGSWLRILALGRNPKITLIRAAILAAVCAVVFKLALLPIRVEGVSMTPAYADRSFHFVNRLAYLWREPGRGDVVGIRLTPQQGLSAPHIMYLKRIVGLPGEAISFADGHLSVNGRTLDEPYEKGPCDWNLAPETLGPDEYFVVGDNRSMPRRDHTFGRVGRDRIVGKAFL
jgi:signal peptidase I